MNGRLYFFIGLPRSGKSTYANQWTNGSITFLEDNKIVHGKLTTWPRVVICADDIRLAMGHRWNGHVESLVHAIKDTMIKALLQKNDVLVDGTHTTEKSIKDLLSIDKCAIPYIIHPNLQGCKERAINTNQEDLLPVIDRMFKQMVDLGNSPIQILKTINSWRDKTYTPEIRD